MTGKRLLLVVAGWCERVSLCNVSSKETVSAISNHAQFQSYWWSWFENNWNWTERSKFIWHCNSIQYKKITWMWNWLLVSFIICPTPDSWNNLKSKLTSYRNVLTSEITVITLMCGLLCFKNRPACYLLSFVGKICTRCNIYSIECYSIAFCNSALSCICKWSNSIE